MPLFAYWMLLLLSSSFPSRRWTLQARNEEQETVKAISN